MLWANFLHIFQPAHQLTDILDKIVNESYRPVLSGFLARPKAKFILNINAGLTELFVNNGCESLVKMLTALSERGQVEFTDSAAYHAFLPMLPEDQITRQVVLNRELNKKFIGPSYNPVGFFAPEMAFEPKIARVVDRLGYQYYILDEIAFNGEIDKTDLTKIYKIFGTNLTALARNRRISNMIMGAVVRSGTSFLEALDKNFSGYVLTAMDGETFGHHRPGLDKLLFEIYEADNIEPVLAKELLEKIPPGGEVDPINCTWACSSEDIRRGIQFALWNDPSNEIHQKQWQLTNLAVESPKRQEMLDRALDSGQYWWASANPWWSVEEIERGAWNLLQVAQTDEAHRIYQNIIETMFDYQRTGRMRKIIDDRKNRQRIPVKDVDPAAYNASIDVLRREEKEASLRGEYEQAIKWRDAAYKLEKGLDIYDTVSIIDQLRAQNKHQDFDDILNKYRERFAKIQSGQPE